jgi:hypothetical protein
VRPWQVLWRAELIELRFGDGVALRLSSNVDVVGIFGRCMNWRTEGGI